MLYHLYNKIMHYTHTCICHYVDLLLQAFENLNIDWSQKTYRKLVWGPVKV